MLSWLFRIWLLFVVIILLAGVGLAYGEWQEVRQEYSTDLHALAAAMADGTQLFLQGAQTSLSMLAQDADRTANITSLLLHEKLQDYLVLNPDFDSVGLKTADNTVITSGMNKDLLHTLLSPVATHKNFFLTTQQQTLITRCQRASGICVGPPLSAPGNLAAHPRWMIPLFLRIQSTSVSPLRPSCLVVLLPLQNGQFSFWHNLPLPAMSSVFLLRQDGFLESRTPPPSKTTFSEIQTGIATQSIRKHPDAHFDTFYGFATAANQWRLGSWYRVQGYPLVAGVGLSRAYLVAVWWKRMIAPLAALFALLLLSTLGYRGFRSIAEARQRERVFASMLLLEAKERAEVTLQSIGDAVITTDIEGHITEANPVAERLLGTTREEVLSKPIEAVFHIVREGDHQAMENPVQRALHEGQVVGLANHTVLMHADGHEIAIEDSAAPILGRDGRVLGAVLVFRDVTERRRQAAELAYQANHDALTGLYNRKMFLEQLRQSMQEALRDERLLLVGILDLDGFKQINDRWGHDQGDQLLCAVAQHLRDALRSGDIVARMGGDEFGLLLPNIRSIDDARNVADHLMQALKQSIPLDAQVVSISASLGFTVLPWDSGDNQQILRHADLALYVAKAQGRNQYCFYEAAMDLEQEHLMETLIMTQEALDDQRLVMYYQPIVTLPQTEGEISANTTMGKGIIGFEALMRLQDPQRGLLTPAAFCEALDHPRLARRIGCYVLDAVLAQGEHWHSTGLIVRLSLNISARHLLDSEFLNDLRCALKAHPGMPPEYCEIEVTESAPMQDFQIAHETLQQCNDLGLRIALDDFGTGNASLSYLQKLPAQTIKIDQSFVRDILNDPRDFAIVAGVTRTASMLGLEVIAEGVETLGHLQLLETLDHPAMQGYFFSRPMPAKAVPAWILSYNPMDYNVKPTQGHNNSAEMTDMGLLRAHNLRVEASIQYLRGQGDCLPDRIIGVDDVAHCHLAVWLDRFTNPATRPPEIDRLHRRLHQILTDNPSQPGSAEAQKLAQELQETNTRLMEELQMFLGERNVYGR